MLLLEFIIVERIEGLAVDCRSEGWIRLAPKSLRSVVMHNSKRIITRSSQSPERTSVSRWLACLCAARRGGRSVYDHRAAMLFVVCCVPVIFSILILGLLAGRAMTAARPGRNRVQVYHNSSDKRRCVAYHQVHKAAGSTVLSILRAHPTRASGIAAGAWFTDGRCVCVCVRARAWYVRACVCARACAHI